MYFTTDSANRAMNLKTLFPLAVCLWLAACASLPSAQLRPEEMFLDKAFAPPSKPVASAEQLFALDEPMRQYLARDIAAALRRNGTRQGLIEALYTKNQLQLNYDTERTRTASEAFAARSGNCLSLVIMTAAFAKELGLQVEYNSVFTEESWSRSGDIFFANTHVNLSLGSPLNTPEKTSSDVNDETIIDFLPAEFARGQRRRVIRENSIVAMYMNNRAAELLARGQLNDAYWHARAAIERDPKYLDAVNTLGIIYRRHGEFALAERVLRSVLETEPENTGALSNLSLVLNDEGKKAESMLLAGELKRIEPYPPFHYFNLGLAALKRSDYTTARDMFQKELKRAAYYHEIHFGLAVAYYQLGDTRRAGEELTEAMKDSTTRADHDLYAAKYAWIQQVRQQQ